MKNQRAGTNVHLDVGGDSKTWLIGPDTKNSNSLRSFGFARSAGSMCSHVTTSSETTFSGWDMADAIASSAIPYDAGFKRYCGFCYPNVFQRMTWRQRNDHFANHFKNGVHMALWHDWPEEDAN